jgi:acetyltransferase
MKKHRLVHRFISKDGLDVRVYRLHADDDDLLINLFEHMSPTSRYQRFNESLDHPDPEYVRRTARTLSEVDPKLGAAWIAVTDLPGEPDAPVAGARFVRTRVPGVAEMSVAVRDDLQRQGIGTELMVFVAYRAKAQGIHKLAASFHTSNRPIWALIADSPFPVTTEIHGAQTDLLLDLDTPEVEEMQEPVLA